MVQGQQWKDMDTSLFLGIYGDHEYGMGFLLCQDQSLLQSLPLSLSLHGLFST